jgi:multicomponent Na+:H+ antiporter subunit E
MVRLLQYMLIPLPMAVIWVILTDQVSLTSLVIGYIIGVGITSLLSRGKHIDIQPAKLPGEITVLVTYSFSLARDVFLSGVDVALRVIGVRPTRTGIIAVSVQDDSDIIAGLSAHSITITPGELVVDFDESRRIMYVHCLDVEMSMPKLDSDQAERLDKFKRILGRD